jgi:integrase
MIAKTMTLREFCIEAVGAQAWRLNAVNRYQAFLDRDPQIGDLTRESLARFEAAMSTWGYAASTRSDTLSALRRLWRLAHLAGHPLTEPPAPRTRFGAPAAAPAERRRAPATVDPVPNSSAGSIAHYFETRYLPEKLAERSRFAKRHYAQAIIRYRVLLKREPMLSDLTETGLEDLATAMGEAAYSHHTIDNTKWLLRAIWFLAFYDGHLPEPPPGPHRSVNQAPEPLVGDITSALAVHRAQLAQESKRKPGATAGAPRQGFGSILKIFQRPPKLPGEPTVKVEPPAPDRDPATVTISEMLAAWRKFAAEYYRVDDGPNHELANMEFALRPLELLYGAELVKDFGPRKLKAVRQITITGYIGANGKAYAGLSRKNINHRIGRIKRVFKWAVSEELAPAGLAHALDSLSSLRMGRSDAYERPRIKPVSLETVEATLPYLPPHVADMVRVQRLTAARPGEICILRPCDVDRSKPLWEYRPAKHKTQYCGHERILLIGPEAQKILEPYLERDAARYCFSPAESETWRKAKLRAARKTPVQPSQIDRSKPTVLSRPGLKYPRTSYSKAIRRACKLAGIPNWHPNQLRHATATKIRQEFGLEAAQVILGHSRADVTQVYAERDGSLAADVMRKIG